MVHVGIGYDVHALVAGRKLILGGVDIPHAKGLEGHSDADVLMHAICDAILGALGEADIGHFFPNTDPRWRGAASSVFLQEAARQVASRQGRIVNVDATIIAQQPKLFPHLQAMKANIAAAKEGKMIPLCRSPMSDSRNVSKRSLPALLNSHPRRSSSSNV